MYANNFYHKRERQIRNAHNRLTVLGKKLSFPIVKRSESTVGALERRYVERARVVLIKQKKVSISSIVFSIFFAFQLCLFEVVCVNIEQMRSGQCFILFHFICFCFANWKQNGHRKHPNQKNPTKKQQQLLFIFPARLCVRRKNHLKCALECLNTVQWIDVRLAAECTNWLPKLIRCARDELYLIDFNWIIDGFVLPFVMMFLSYRVFSSPLFAVGHLFGCRGMRDCSVYNFLGQTWTIGRRNRTHAQSNSCIRCEPIHFHFR